MSLKILADENIPQLDKWFAPLGEVRKIAGRDLTAEQVGDADVLLVRSVTQVNQQLLANSRVRFVGTATIGTDHLDTAWLDAQNICWASAPGSNATSVVEYVLAALCEVDDVLERLLAGAVVGIVGGGNVGSRLCHRLQSLGITVQVFDPFLTAASGLPLVSWENILKTDVLCLHTPLTCSGEYPTQHLFNQKTLGQLAPHTLLLNAGRGAVIDNAALLQWLAADSRNRAVLDVWENEPAIDRNLFNRVAIGTPHIAGYSLDGKHAGSWQLYQAIMDWLKNPTSTNVQDDVDQMLSIHVPSVGSKSELIRQVMCLVYPVCEDHNRLAAVMQSEDDVQRRAGFDRLRREYPVRREIAAYRIVNWQGLSAATREILLAMGFKA
jgi:erythronate-4-phosphate dehydrogenase